MCHVTAEKQAEPKKAARKEEEVSKAGPGERSHRVLPVLGTEPTPILAHGLLQDHNVQREVLRNEDIISCLQPTTAWLDASCLAAHALHGDQS